MHVAWLPKSAPLPLHSYMQAFVCVSVSALLVPQSGKNVYMYQYMQEWPADSPYMFHPIWTVTCKTLVSL